MLIARSNYADFSFADGGVGNAVFADAAKLDSPYPVSVLLQPVTFDGRRHPTNASAVSYGITSKMAAVRLEQVFAW